MKIRIEDDGSLKLRERLWMLRLSGLLGSAVLAGVLVWSYRLDGALSRNEVVSGGIGILALFALAASAADRTFHFDRSTGRLRWSVWRLVAWQRGTVEFDHVLRVSARERINTNSRRARPEYQPILVTRTRTLALSSFHHSNPTECESLGRAVYEAMGRRWQALAGSGHEPLAAERNAIAVILQARRQAMAEGRTLGLAEAREAVRQATREAEGLREAA